MRVWLHRKLLEPRPPRNEERELRMERALRLARLALVREEHAAHDMVAVIDSALLKPK